MQQISGTVFAIIIESIGSIGSIGGFAGLAAAQTGGGYTGPSGIQSITVAEAAGLADDTDVRMEGFLVRSLGDEEYELQDGTGLMVVEIDDDEWQGMEVSTETRVVLEGELDSEQSGMELDVDRIRPAAQ